MTNDLGQSIITIAKNRMVLEHPAQIRECLAQLDEGQIWWRPNASANSVGNMIIHLCGATRHFFGRGVGGTDYVRDRDAEFAERGPLPTGALLTILDGTVAETDRILAGLTGDKLFDRTTNIEADMPVLVCLMRMSHHWSYHTGQIVYVTKSLKEGVINDLFRKTMVK